MGKTKKGFNKKGLCKLCKELRTPEGHDPCIANLPGVLYACCGHGLESGYIKFNDGRVLRFHPICVDLEIAENEMIGIPEPPTPIYIDQPHHELNFKTGETMSRRADWAPIAISIPVEIRRRT